MVRMKLALAVILVAIGATLVVAQDKPATNPAGPQMSADEMMQQGMKLAQPGEAHQRLAKQEGTWKVSGKFFMPGAPPMQFTGTQDAKMIFGGRFLHIEGKTEGAQPMMKGESLTVLGYDNRTRKHTLWGIDTFGTYSISAAGDWDEATNSITYVGENEEPGMGKVPFKFVVKHSDENHYTLELSMQFPGMGWTKIMEASYERA
jgi:hypothetical protein